MFRTIGDGPWAWESQLPAGVLRLPEELTRVDALLDDPVFCQGRISYLNHRYCWDRTRLDGRNGAAIWCGQGVFAHNLIKIAALTR